MCRRAGFCTTSAAPPQVLAYWLTARCVFRRRKVHGFFLTLRRLAWLTQSPSLQSPITSITVTDDLPAARQGVNNVLHCSSYGISTLFSRLPPDLDQTQTSPSGDMS